MPGGLTTLWRPTGPEELELVRRSGWRVWPPRLPEQPIFYPVLNEDYAIRIARDWNAPRHGVGYVTCFRVSTEFLARYAIRQVGGETILELWVPAEELDEFNAHISGLIEVVHEFRPDLDRR
ncbi:ADP-ribosylation/crystallin J1 [Microbispora sp. NPDC088329]|uniref:ADP-ribosylation/crystallin J1 n=1 Tax=Microbispora sp. NPDC088329 TaxID=3154869 RepID=UPI0034414147